MIDRELGYTVTTNPIFLDELNKIPAELLHKLEEYHQLAMEGKKSSVRKILDAIEQYPDNPQLKNYLSVLYGKLNDAQKLHDVNKWINREHPNYLFGKLNLANEYYENQEYDKMAEVLGSDMDLKALYPDRDIFHLDEVVSFLKCSILYFAGVGDEEQTKIRYEIMEEIAPNTPDKEFYERQLFIASLKAGQKRHAEQQKSKILVVTKSQELKNITQSPIFYHKEMEWLYCNGLNIGEEKINTILAIPRDTLIQDLELVLQDSIDRFAYFKKWTDENEWEEEKMNFLIHSLCLLGELRAKESIDAIFHVFSQSYEYLQLYLGDFIPDLMWEVVYKIADHNLEACKQFIFKPGVDTFARAIMTDMVEQLIWHHPERRDESIFWFKDVMQFFLDSSNEDNVIDSDLIAFIICNLIDIKGKELFPEIEKLFDRKMVSEDICGDWTDVRKAFNRPEKHIYKREILNIIERYKKVTSTWAGYKKEESNFDFDYKYDYQPVNKPYIAKPKIGRNKPCPCGSGKKYKKCCLNK